MRHIERINGKGDELILYIYLYLPLSVFCLFEGDACSSLSVVESVSKLSLSLLPYKKKKLKMDDFFSPKNISLHFTFFTLTIVVMS